MSNPLWKQILSEEGKRRFELRVGPSIPFVIGAYFLHHIFTNNDLQTSKCIEKLFNEILSTQGDVVVNIQPCGTLGTDIIAIRPEESSYMLTSANADELCTAIWNKYDKYIKQHLFSIDKDDHSWRNFNEQEIDNIKSLVI